MFNMPNDLEVFIVSENNDASRFFCEGHFPDALRSEIWMKCQSLRLRAYIECAKVEGNFGDFFLNLKGPYYPNLSLTCNFQNISKNIIFF